MSILAAEMPKKKEATNVVLTFMPEPYAELKALAEKEHRSLKNYTETIVLKHLENVKELSKKKK